jgi:hypothetical protein
LNLKDFFEFGRLDFALNGQTHTHTHTQKKKIPMEKWEIPPKTQKILPWDKMSPSKI